jgi:hypothetical protein
MNPWDEWLSEVEIKPVLPERIREMLKVYGTKEGKTCKTCKYLLRYYQSARWMKCKKSYITGGNGTDWKAGWPACGKHEEIDV